MKNKNNKQNKKKKFEKDTYDDNNNNNRNNNNSNYNNNNSNNSNNSNTVITRLHVSLAQMLPPPLPPTLTSEKYASRKKSKFQNRSSSF